MQQQAMAQRIARAMSRHAILHGVQVSKPAIFGLAQAAVSALAPPTERARPRLTDTEQAILGYLASGYSTWQIGRELGCPESTARKQIGRLVCVLGAVSRSQAIALAYEHGYLLPGHPQPASAAQAVTG